jgi:hypothetical protein
MAGARQPWVASGNSSASNKAPRPAFVGPSRARVAQPRLTPPPPSRAGGDQHTAARARAGSKDPPDRGHRPTQGGSVAPRPDVYALSRSARATASAAVRTPSLASRRASRSRTARRLRNSSDDDHSSAAELDALLHRSAKREGARFARLGAGPSRKRTRGLEPATFGSWNQARRGAAPRTAGAVDPLLARS